MPGCRSSWTGNAAGPGAPPRHNGMSTPKTAARHKCSDAIALQDRASVPTLAPGDVANVGEVRAPASNGAAQGRADSNWPRFVRDWSVEATRHPPGSEQRAQHRDYRRLPSLGRRRRGQPHALFAFDLPASISSSWVVFPQVAVPLIQRRHAPTHDIHQHWQCGARRPTVR